MKCKVCLFFMLIGPAFTLYGAVEFIALLLSTDGESVSIEWSTASETQNLGFILERKSDTLSQWEPLDDYIGNDLLLGQGTVSSQTDYLYVDSNVTPGLLYIYRIAGVDEANNIGWLDSASIRVEQTSVHTQVPEIFDLKVFPNPFNAVLNISFSLPENISCFFLEIYDVHGKLLEKKIFDQYVMSGSYRIRWHSGNMGSGIYLCRIRTFGLDGSRSSISRKTVLLK